MWLTAGRMGQCVVFAGMQPYPGTRQKHVENATERIQLMTGPKIPEKSSTDR
jgi:hypothetical protein